MPAMLSEAHNLMALLMSNDNTGYLPISTIQITH